MGYVTELIDLDGARKNRERLASMKEASKRETEEINPLPPEELRPPTIERKHRRIRNNTVKKAMAGKTITKRTKRVYNFGKKRNYGRKKKIIS